jgi:hypothetical protein
VRRFIKSRVANGMHPNADAGLVASQCSERTPPYAVLVGFTADRRAIIFTVQSRRTRKAQEILDHFCPATVFLRIRASTPL